jgi:hypothetical protein
MSSDMRAKNLKWDEIEITRVTVTVKATATLNDSNIEYSYRSFIAKKTCSQHEIPSLASSSATSIGIGLCTYTKISSSDFIDECCQIIRGGSRVDQEGHRNFHGWH